MTKRRGNGEGSVYRRTDGRVVGEYVDANGRRRYVSGKTKTEVKAKLRKLLADRDEGMGHLVNQGLEVLLNVGTFDALGPLHGLPVGGTQLSSNEHNIRHVPRILRSSHGLLQGGVDEGADSLSDSLWRSIVMLRYSSGCSKPLRNRHIVESEASADGFRDRGSVSSQLDAVRKHYCTAFYELGARRRRA
jgi:hypothetical protein